MVTPTDKVSVLTNSVIGTPIRFANDLDIAVEGTIYFTDSSRKFSCNKTMLNFYEHRPNGSLLAYNPKTQKTTPLLAGLYFSNGVAINPDQTFWIDLVQGPESRRRIDWLLPQPFLRRVLLRIPRSLRPSFSPIGFVLGVNFNGEVVMDLRDPTGTTFAKITSVIEHNNTLYFGTISEKAIGCFSLLDYSTPDLL